MSLNDDVKPRVGPIPEVRPLPHTLVGKNYFKVDLFVHNNSNNNSGGGGDGGEGELMLPFKQTSVRDSPLSNGWYVATQGLSFSIRVKLERAASEGVQYGARVYVDSGRSGSNQVYTHWADPDDNDGCHAHEVDISKADHYFWFEPGQKEAWIRGFYKSPTESRQFVFAEPPKKRDSDQETNPPSNLEELLDTFGAIRIMFCQVEGMRKRSPGELNRLRHKTVRPQGASIPAHIDKKIRLVAKPGGVIQDGAEPQADVAILSKGIVYERRIHYNSFEGFTAIQGYRYAREVDFYKGMPLAAMKLKPIRHQGIMTFFRAVAAKRVDLSEEEKWKEWETNQSARDDQGKTDDDGAGTNDFVRVEDIVHFIMESLSPAASYILCTGKNKVGDNGEEDYGELHIQNSKASVEERKRDYAEKERGLVTFFGNEPGTYELVLVGRDPSKNPPENYQVKLAVLEIGDSDDDD